MNENLTTTLGNEDDLLTGGDQPENDDTPEVDTGTEGSDTPEADTDVEGNDTPETDTGAESGDIPEADTEAEENETPETDTNVGSETEQPDIPAEDSETDQPEDSGEDETSGQTDPPADGEEDGEETSDSTTDPVNDPAADDKAPPSDDGKGSDSTADGSDTTTTGPADIPDTGATDPGDGTDGGNDVSGEGSGEADDQDIAPGPNEGAESGEEPDDLDDSAESGSDQTGEQEITGDSNEQEEDETGELIEVPVDDPKPDISLGPIIGILLGISVLLAVAVAVLTALLVLAKKKNGKKKAGAFGSVDIGKLHAIGKRDGQQDSFGVSPLELMASHGLLAVVADGMGGLEDGDKVSQAAVAAMQDGFMSAVGTPQNVLLSLTEQANFRINSFLGPAKIGKCGSTMVAGLIRDGMFHYLSIGDSRICLYRDGQLMQLNREHVYRHDLTIQALSGVGSIQGAAQHPKAAGLTSFLGMGQLRYVDIPASGIEIRSGDKFILMSDGVYNALTAAEISGALNKDAQQAADALGSMIAQKAYRNQDNYTAVILAC